MSSVAAGIVSYGTREALRRCLHACSRALPPDADIIVVDNASPDGSAEMVRAEFPQVLLVALDSNRGFAAGVNAAFAATNAPALLLLNPDVEPDPEGLRLLRRFLDDHPDAAAVGPLLVDEAGRPQFHLYRRFPTFAQVALFWTLLRPLASRLPALRHRWLHQAPASKPVRVEQLPGAAMLIRRQAWDIVGPFDPDYFLWWEDVDWAWRVREAGLSQFLVPDARFSHAGGLSFRSWSAANRVAQFYRAFVRFAAKHDPGLLSLLPLLRSDLFVKDAALALGRVLRIPAARRIGSLRGARKALAEAAALAREGRIPAFSGPVGEHREPAPLLASAAPVEEPSGSGSDIAAVIVNWNGRRFLDRAIDALSRSTVPVRVIVVDNASTDGSAEHVRAAHPGVHLIASASNLGYAAGANLGLGAVRERYAFVMNPDVLVEPDHLERLRDRLEAEPRIGAAQGKLYRISPEAFEAGAPERAVLDSAGHVIRRSRMVLDRGQGEPDAAEYDREASVFSACGAALFLRMAMLRDLAPDGRFFAESFFAYKEDIDLCWRARVLGWDVRYLPSAVAHHVRTLPLGGSAWRSMSLGARRHSWKNHWLLMLRNDRMVDVLRHLPWILGWELLRLAHALFRDPALLPVYIDARKQLPDAMRERTLIQQRRRVTGTQISSWFGDEKPS